MKHFVEKGPMKTGNIIAEMDRLSKENMPADKNLIEAQKNIEANREVLAEKVLVFNNLGSVEYDEQNDLLIVNHGEWKISYNRAGLSKDPIFREIPKDAQKLILELMEQGLQELNKREREG
jgi:hypothetical protein